MKRNLISCSSAVVLLLLLSCNSSIYGAPEPGGGGGGGRGGGGGGGRGGLSGSAKAGLFAAGVGGSVGAGVATYAAYKGGDPRGGDYGRGGEYGRGNYLVDNYRTNYNVQESKYSRRRGVGMSATTIIFLILGILGTGFGVWCCHTVCLPYWRDRRSDHYTVRRDSDIDALTGGGGSGGGKAMEAMALHDTPSTATPSP